MEENKVTKIVYFWSTGEKFENNDIDRIYDEMNYNYYSPSNLANGLTEEDYGAFTDKTFDEAKEIAKGKVINFDKFYSFCYLIKQYISLSKDEWGKITDENGIVNLTKLGTDKFPEFTEPTYSIAKNNNDKEALEHNIFEENTIHINPQKLVDPTVLDLVTSDNNQRFRLLNNLYSFADKTGIFSEKYSKDLSKLNKYIREENQSKTSKIQTLDKLGKTMQNAIPLKVLCYMISDAILLMGKKKEYSQEQISDFENEKEQMIKSIRDYAKKNEIDVEDIFDTDGKLKPRSETIDNANFNINKNIQEEAL